MRTRVLLLFLAFGILIASSPLQAVPVHHWSKRFGDAGPEIGRSIAIDGSGNVVVTGNLSGTFGFVGFDVFVAKFDANGNQIWSQRFGNINGQDARSVATDGSGNVVVTGYFTGTVDFGGGVLTSAGNQDIFVAKFDAGGSHIWSKRFGDVFSQEGWSVAVDAPGNVVVCGSFGGTVDFGGGPLTGSGSPDIFVAKFDADGDHLWSRGFVNPGEQRVRSLATDASGNIAFTGQATGTVNFGGAPITGDYDIFLAKLDPNGNHLWSRFFAGADLDTGLGVAADGLGNIILTGYFYGSANLGGGNLQSPGNNNEDIFLAKYDANGAHLWSKRFGNTGDDKGNGVAVGPLGSVVITGGCTGPVDFGGGSLTGAGIFIAQFDAGGAHVWSQLFGPSSGTSIAADGTGSVVATGYFYGTADFGGGPLTDAGNGDVFVAKFGEQSLPVLITSFKAQIRAGAVEITWDLWSDEAIESFTLYRRDDVRLQAIVVAEGPIDATTRSYVDARVEPGKMYHYELVIHTSAGDDIRSPVASVTLPALAASLEQNHPNPFNPETTIDYTLGERSPAVVTIYDAAGALVARLDQGVQDAGAHHVTWNGRDAHGHTVASGVYFYSLEGAKHVEARKMVLLK